MSALSMLRLRCRSCGDCPTCHRVLLEAEGRHDLPIGKVPLTFGPHRGAVRAVSALVLLVLGLALAGCSPAAPTPGSACDVLPLDTGQTFIECPAGTSLRFDVESDEGFGFNVFQITPEDGMQGVDDYAVLATLAGCDPVSGTNATGRFTYLACGGSASVTVNTGSGTLIGVGPPPGGTARVTGVS